MVELSSDRYRSLVDKYRPRFWRDVVGQEGVVGVLKGVLRKKKIPALYVFSGASGVGKTSVARVFAKALNCENLDGDMEVCGRCESCESFDREVMVSYVEIDGATNRGIDDVRKIQEVVASKPLVGRYKVVVVDECHMLTNEAISAFLKTLEEPKRWVVFIFVTTNEEKLIETVKTRSLLLRFGFVSDNKLRGFVKYVCDREGIVIDSLALDGIVRLAGGSVRKALKILELVWLKNEGVGKGIIEEKDLSEMFIVDSDKYDLVRAFLRKDVVKFRSILYEMVSKGVKAVDIVLMIFDLVVGGWIVRNEDMDLMKKVFGEEEVSKLQYLEVSKEDFDFVVENFLVWYDVLKNYNDVNLLMKFLLRFMVK